MEDLNLLQDLYNKQKDFESELVQTKQRLSDRIKENYNIMLSELKSHTDQVLQMVEEAFAETADKVQVGLNTTESVIKDAKTKAEMVRKDLEQKRKVAEKKDQTRKSESAISETEQVTPESQNELKKQKDPKITSNELKLTLKTKRKSDEIQETSPDENLQHKSNSSVQSKELILKKKHLIKLRGSYNIRSSSDSNVCDINGVCCLASGEIILTDTANKLIKEIDHDFNMVVIQGNNLISTPFSICQVYGRNFVLSDNNYIHGDLRFISIDTNGNLNMAKGFSTGIRNWSVVSHQDNINILCENKKHPYYNLRQYNFNGGACRSTNIHVQGQFMCFNSDGSLLYVTSGTAKFEGSNTVKVLDCKHNWPKEFQEQVEFSSPNLNMPCGVVVDKNDQVYVCGLVSKNVIQFDKDGNEVGVLLEGDDALNGPKVLGYDRTNHRLIVAGNADEIKVFDLK